MVYNESHAIVHISQIVGEHITKDQILNVIDVIWDYYENNGLLDISFDDVDDFVDDEVDSNELIKYVSNIIYSEFEMELTFEDIKKIVLAELDYEKTLDIL